jgi:hypothetical protein
MNLDFESSFDPQNSEEYSSESDESQMELKKL